MDIVETGTTLRENGLKVVTEFLPISARFIANKASYQFKHAEMDTMLEKLRAQLAEQGGSKMIKLYNFDELKPEEILNRDIRAEKNVEDVVDGIIADVRARGDEALKDYALNLTGLSLKTCRSHRKRSTRPLRAWTYFLETLRAGGGQHRELPPPAGAQELCGER